MWLLSSDSRVLGGKRLWLRPGTQHVLGRTSTKTAGGQERYQYVEHKSVSRKHLLLKVAEVQPDDCADVSARPVITATDASKTGTTIDGNKLSKSEEKTLSGDRHTIRLGSWEHTFTLEWRPAVLTYKLKASLLAEERKKLESTGIKLVSEYVETTTHVLAKNRNTSHGLMALVRARWLVAPSFLDAVATACMRAGADDNGNPHVSPLEDDFDANWPKEEEYIPPTAGEPVKRDAHWLRPNPDRASVFEHFTFVLFSAKQRDSLLPVIQAGGGKALAYTFVQGETTKEEVVDYVVGVAGKKNPNNSSLVHDEGPGGIVVIRGEAKDASRDNELMQSIDIALNQRSVEQNELLDVIIENNASVLCRPLRFNTQTTAPTPTAEHRASVREASSYGGARANEDVVTGTQDAPPTQQNTATTPFDGMTALQKLRARRAIKQREMDDDHDHDSVARAVSKSPEPSFRAPSEAPSEPRMDIDELSQRAGTQQSTRNTRQSTRKRPAPPPEEESGETHEQMMDRLMPGNTNYKRQKTGALADPKPKPQAAKGIEPEPELPKGKGKKAVKVENDLQAQMRAQREKQEAERQKDEDLKREMRETDVSQIKINHQYVYFELPVRPSREASTATGEGRGDRWNPAWNGRPNFKKFRPKRNRQGAGEGGVAEPVPQRVVIQLEEIPGKGHGLGDEYWLETSHSKSKKKSQSQRQSQSQPGRTSAAAAGDSDNDQLSFRRRLQQSREDDAQEEIAADEIFDEEGTSQSTMGRTTTQSSRAVGSSAAPKRAATSQATGGPPAKKARQAAARPTTARASASKQDDSDEEDDPLAFKRRRR